MTGGQVQARKPARSTGHLIRHCTWKVEKPRQFGFPVSGQWAVPPSRHKMFAVNRGFLIRIVALAVARFSGQYEGYLTLVEQDWKLLVLAAAHADRDSGESPREVTDYFRRVALSKVGPAPMTISSTGFSAG